MNKPNSYVLNQTIKMETNRITPSEVNVNQILEQSLNGNPWSKMVVWKKEPLMNEVNTRLSAVNLKNEGNVMDLYGRCQKFWKENDKIRRIGDDLWEKVKNKVLITDTIKDVSKNKVLNNQNILESKSFLRTNKETINSNIPTTNIPTSLVEKKPLGLAGDITINEIINKSFEIGNFSLVQMVIENVNAKICGYSLSSVLMYRAVMKLFMKSAYGNPAVILPGPSTRTKEIALFMILGAPFIVGSLMTINAATSGKFGTKLVTNLAENNELEVPENSKVNSSSSLFLFYNKLPRWLKAVLKYLALYLILLFILNVLGFESKMLIEISSQFHLYLGYFIKVWAILNFLVIIYYIWKLYIIIMFAKKKEFLNPEDYPKFIKNELMESKEIAIKQYLLDPGKVNKHYLKLIILYISIVIFGLTVMVLNTTFLFPSI